MKFRHLHSTKGREPYGLFVLLVQLDFTIGGSKKWIIVKYFNALKYKKDQSLEARLQDIRYCTRVNLGMFVIAVILTILNITRI